MKLPWSKSVTNDTSMKLSEAIKEGSKITDQAIGKFYGNPINKTPYVHQKMWVIHYKNGKTKEIWGSEKTWSVALGSSFVEFFANSDMKTKKCPFLIIPFSSIHEIECKNNYG